VINDKWSSSFNYQAGARCFYYNLHMTWKFSKLLPVIFGFFGLLALIAVAAFFLFLPPKYGEFNTQDISGYHNYHPDFFRYADKQRIVLYFSAPWCSTCALLDEDISQNRSVIPNDLTILKVDYDSHHALRRQYKVLTQHTLILLDANGQEIQRWAGTEDLTTVLKNLGVNAQE